MSKIKQIIDKVRKFRISKKSIKIIIAVVFAVVLIAGGGLAYNYFVGDIFGYNFFNSGDRTALIVDGEVVTQSELSRVMKDKEVDAISYFSKTYNATTANTDNFWFTQFGDNKETPLSYLKQISADEAARIKIKQIKARSYGLIQDITYKTFLQDFQTEKIARQDPNNKVAGVRNITEVYYFTEVFTKLEDRLKQSLSDDGTIKVPADTSTAYYKANIDSYKLNDNMVLDMVSGTLKDPSRKDDTKLFPDYTDQEKAQISSDIDKITKAITNGADPTATCTKFTDASTVYSYSYFEMTMDQEFIGRDIDSYQMYAGLVANAKVGAWNPAQFYTQIGINSLMLKSRDVQGYTSYQDALPQLESILSGQLYEKYFDDQLAQYKADNKITYYWNIINDSKLRSDGSY
jgi:hypothetical protein